jgi:hypothetical protein
MPTMGIEDKFCSPFVAGGRQERAPPGDRRGTRLAQWPLMAFRPTITLTGSLVLLAVIGLVACLAAPAIARSRRQSDWINARASLIAIVEAEQVFRTNDVDHSRSHLFWTRDVRGLAEFGLIEPPLALADSAYPEASPRYGHFFAMLEGDPGEPPFDDGTGHGPIFAVSMYAEPRHTPFLRTYVYCSDRGYKSADSRTPIRRMREDRPDVSWGTWCD